MSRLAGFVYAVGPDGSGQWFGPDTEWPDWVAGVVTNPKAWVDGQVPEVETGQGGPPPRSGRGSGLDEWKAYAELIGVTVDSEASRDDVIAAVDAASTNGAGE